MPVKQSRACAKRRRPSYMGTDGRWNGANSPCDRPVATRARGWGRTGRSDGSPTDLTPGSAHCTGKPRLRVARGGTQGGLNCLTHALPRCLPTPTEEADGNGYGVIAGWRGPPRPPLRASRLTYLVPHCCSKRPAFGSIPRLNLRADRQEPLPRFRCPALPGFPWTSRNVKKKEEKQANTVTHSSFSSLLL